MSKKPITRNKPKDSQVLMEFYQGEIQLDELTPHQRNKLDRIRTIHGAWMAFKQPYEILAILKDMYGISDAQGYRDIKLCEMIYGNLQSANKDMDRQRAKNMALETYNLAHSHQDTKGMALANKNFNDASGILKDDPDMPDFSKLQPSVYAIIADEFTQALLAKFTETQGPLNLSQFMNQQAEDAEIITEPTRADQPGDTEASQEGER